MSYYHSFQASKWASQSLSVLSAVLLTLFIECPNSEYESIHLVFLKIPIIEHWLDLYTQTLVSANNPTMQFSVHY